METGLCTVKFHKKLKFQGSAKSLEYNGDHIYRQTFLFFFGFLRSAVMKPEFLFFFAIATLLFSERTGFQMRWTKYYNYSTI